MTNKKYIPEFVYGAIDGTVTTFAVVAGAIGASLSPGIVLILGFANLFADGFSMAVSNYLSTKSNSELLRTKIKNKIFPSISKKPINTAMITFLSFFIIGLIPLLPFISSYIFYTANAFLYSIIFTAIAFLLVGYIKGFVVKRHPFYSALETLVIGSVASALAFLVGYLLKGLV